MHAVPKPDNQSVFGRIRSTTLHHNGGVQVFRLFSFPIVLVQGKLRKDTHISCHDTGPCSFERGPGKSDPSHQTSGEFLLLSHIYISHILGPLTLKRGYGPHYRWLD